MKVRMVRDLGEYRKGVTYALDREKALTLVRAGLAVPVKAFEAERAIHGPQETSKCT